MPAPPPRSVPPNWKDLETSHPFGKNGQGWTNTWEAPEQQHPNPVLVCGFGPGTTADAVEDLLATVGKVKDVHLPKKPNSEETYGFALVKFAENWDAAEAIKNLNGAAELGGTLALQDGKASSKLLRQWRKDLAKAATAV